MPFIPFSGWDPSDDDVNRGVSEHPGIARLVPDPDNLPDLAVFRGWLGRSGVPNIWRVYLNLHLTEYVEVGAADIVYATTVDEWTAVWVSRDASVHRVTRRPWDAEVEYLTGGVTDRVKAERRFDGDAYRSGAEWDTEPTNCLTCRTKSC